MNPPRAGFALAVTVGLFYVLCTLIWAVAPGPFLGFMNGLFHGMEFGSMVRPKTFAWPAFLTSLLVMSTWAFMAGAFFTALLNRLTR